MPTRLYRFHCTDGHDLVVDLRGRRIPTVALMRLHAEQVALDLMARGVRIDWSAWHVEVYDEKGRAVLAKAFTEVRYDRRAGRASVIKTKRLVPGELEGATILGQFGEIPEDFADSLQGGSAQPPRPPRQRN